MSDRGERVGGEPPIEEAILAAREGQAMTPEQPLRSLGAAAPEDVQPKPTLQSPTSFQGERTALWGQSRADLETLQTAAQAALDSLEGADDDRSNSKRRQAGRDLDEATAMLQRLDAATEKKNAAGQAEAFADPQPTSPDISKDEKTRQREADIAAVQEGLNAATAQKGQATPVASSDRQAFMNAGAIPGVPNGKSVESSLGGVLPLTGETILPTDPDVTAAFAEKLKGHPVNHSSAKGADEAIAGESHIDSFINRNTSQVEVSSPAAKVIDIRPEDVRTGPTTSKPPRMILTPKERIPQTAAEDETAVEQEPTIAEQPEGVVRAREKYASYLKKQKKWLGAPSPKELEQVRIEYIQEVQQTITTAVGEVKKKYEGQDLQNPETNALFQADLISATIAHRSTEAQELRETMRTSEHRRVLDKVRTWWKANPKLRFAVGAGLTGVAVAGAATGQLWITGLAAGTRAVLSGTSTFLAVEGAGHNLRKSYGETQERRSEDLEQMKTVDLERALAAHTMLQVDEGLKDFGVLRRGVFKKRNDETGKNLLEAYDQRLRQDQEKTIQEMVQKGEPIDKILEVAVFDNEVGMRRMNESIERRIVTNKKANVAIGTAAGVAGALMGAFGISSAMRFGEHVAGFFHSANDHKETAADALEKAMGASAEKAADHIDHLGFQGAAVDATRHSLGTAAPTEQIRDANAALRAAMEASVHADHAASTAETAHSLANGIEVAKSGDSVWSMTERFVTGHYPNLSPEQRTWMIDSIKDKLAAHPDVVGLKDINQIREGASIDFDKLGFDYTNIAGQATKLSKGVTESIHDHLATHVDHVTASAVEQGATAAQESSPSIASSAANDIPKAVRNIPVMIQDEHGRLVEMGSHLEQLDHGSAVGSAVWNPNVEAGLERYRDALGVWLNETPTETFTKWNEAMRLLPPEEAMKPGVLEALFQQHGAHDPEVEAKMIQGLREAYQALPPGEVKKFATFGELLTQMVAGKTEIGQ